MEFEAIGRNIAAIRKERGWTQVYLAKKLGVYPNSISEAEKKGRMSLETIGRYAEALGCTISDLTEGFTDLKNFHLETDITQYWPYSLAYAVGFNPPSHNTHSESYRNAESEARERIYGVYIPALLKSLEDLTEREQKVLYMRHNNHMTLEQVGKELGVTRDRIRQIEAKAIRKLRSPRHYKHWMFDTVEKGWEIAKERDALKLENISLREKLSKVMESLGMKKDAGELLEPVQKEIDMDLPIDNLELSVRSYNCLKRAGYDKLSDFTGKTMDDLMKCRNLGRKSLSEVVERLREHGIELEES